MQLDIKKLAVSIEGKKVVHDVSFSIRAGEIHALMGPNGSGKSSLAYAIAGNPEYVVTHGSITLDGMTLLELPPEKRAEMGLFLSFQEPPEIGGVGMGMFMDIIKKKEKEPEERKEALAQLHLGEEFLTRSLNEGFSGGEKKKSEILQFLTRRPKFAIFDEIDSGLDVDSIRAVSDILQDAAKKDKVGIVVISHSPRLFEKLIPDRVYIMKEGRIVARGGKEIIGALEKNGYGVY